MAFYENVAKHTNFQFEKPLTTKKFTSILSDADVTSWAKSNIAGKDTDGLMKLRKFEIKEFQKQQELFQSKILALHYLFVKQFDGLTSNKVVKTVLNCKIS